LRPERFAGRGHLSFWLCLALSAVAAVLADGLWFQLGRKKGIRVLQFLCRISLEPDSCVRRTEGVFAKQGARSLLVAKFRSWPEHGCTSARRIFHMRRRRFSVVDFLGSVLWAGAFLLLGYIFSEQIEVIAERAASLGSGFDGADCGALGGYITWKFIGRRRFLRELRIGRITPEELKEKIDAREELVMWTCATPSISKPTRRRSRARFTWT